MDIALITHVAAGRFQVRVAHASGEFPWAPEMPFGIHLPVVGLHALQEVTRAALQQLARLRRRHADGQPRHGVHMVRHHEQLDNLDVVAVRYLPNQHLAELPILLLAEEVPSVLRAPLQVVRQLAHCMATAHKSIHLHHLSKRFIRQKADSSRYPTIEYATPITAPSTGCLWRCRPPKSGSAYGRVGVGFLLACVNDKAHDNQKKISQRLSSPP